MIKHVSVCYRRKVVLRPNNWIHFSCSRCTLPWIDLWAEYGWVSKLPFRFLPYTAASVFQREFFVSISFEIATVSINEPHILTFLLLNVYSRASQFVHTHSHVNFCCCCSSTINTHSFTHSLISFMKLVCACNSNTMAIHFTCYLLFIDCLVTPKYGYLLFIMHTQVDTYIRMKYIIFFCRQKKSTWQSFQ